MKFLTLFFPFYLGPVVGILGQKYGARPIALTGAIIGVLGAGICYYAENILWITILWGGICGMYNFPITYF